MPKQARKVPSETAFTTPLVTAGDGQVFNFTKFSNRARADVIVESESTNITFPIVYFNGWKGRTEYGDLEIHSEGDYGLISTKVKNGTHAIILEFKDTRVRTIGNYISLVTILMMGYLYIQKHHEI